MKFCYNTSFTLPTQSQHLDPSYKLDLDFWDCFGRKKKLSIIAKEIRFLVQALFLSS